MDRKEQRLPLTDVLWVLGLLIGSVSTFLLGLWVGSGFVHSQGEAVTWPTALGWLELLAAFLSAAAVAGAGWIAYRSLRAQREALEHQEWLQLLERRLQFREDVRREIAVVQYKQEGHETAGLRIAQLKRAAPYLLGPDASQVVDKVFDVCSTLDTLRTGARVTNEEGDPEGAEYRLQEVKDLNRRLYPLRDELEEALRPYLQRQSIGSTR